MEEENNFVKNTSNSFKSKNSKKELMDFHQCMQWAAFLTAKVICNDNLAKIELMSLLTKGQKRIPLHHLIGATSITTKFKEAFHYEFNYYFGEQFGEGIDSNKEEDTPPRPRGSKRNPIPFEDFLKQFMKHMIEEKLVELYFPNGLSFLENYTMSSTAHPMTQSPRNIGILRRNHKDIRYDEKAAIVVQVNHMYLFKHTNIIVARPYRQAGRMEGLYEAYPDINFEDFLSY